MVTLPSQLEPIGCLPGVQPPTDRTSLSTKHYTAAQSIRFRNGIPEKIGGWNSINFAYGSTIRGTVRSILSVVLGNSPQTLIGTSSHLYSLHAQQLINITPLETTTHAVSNSLSTDYGTLATNPIQTTLGSGTITVLDANAAKYTAGDVVTLSGATTTNGITNTAINGQHVIRSFVTGGYLLNVGGSATSTGAGGGASVVRATGRITVAATANLVNEGDRVGILGATAVGGIGTGLINIELIARNVTTNTFDVMTTGTATSAVTGGGGTGTTFQKQIRPGLVNAAFGVGYGDGLYGVGLYGVAGQTTQGLQYPQIWFMDRYGESVILTPGNQQGLYIWDGDTRVAPILVANAPTAINYAFVSNNIGVTLGANAQNQIFASDQDNIVNWTGSSTNQVFEDNLEGAERLISSVQVNGANLLFSETQTYSFSYIGLPNVWNIQQLEKSIGIIGPMARCAVHGYAYWVGQKNIYRWWGGNVEIVPSNSQLQATVIDYIFKNMNFTQKSKTFMWYNAQFDELWIHYPSLTSNEPDTVARLALQDMSWVPDKMPRTAAEYPNNLFAYPMLANVGTIYNHENGTDADGVALPWSLSSNIRNDGKENMLLGGFIPDSTQVGDINVNVISWQFPQSGKQTINKNYTVSTDTDIMPTQLPGRYFQWTLSGTALGQSWRGGQWMEYIQPSSPR